jgi:hypothetical protein
MTITTTLTVTLTVTHGPSIDPVSDLLYPRGGLQYVWNNAATLYRGRGVTITDMTIKEEP